MVDHRKQCPECGGKLNVLGAIGRMRRTGWTMKSEHRCETCKAWVSIERSVPLTMLSQPKAANG